MPIQMPSLVVTEGLDADAAGAPRVGIARRSAAERTSLASILESVSCGHEGGGTHVVEGGVGEVEEEDEDGERESMEIKSIWRSNPSR